MSDTLYNALIAFQGRTPKRRSVYVGTEGEHNVQTVTFENLPVIPNVIYTMNIVMPDGSGGDVLDVTENKVIITRTYTQQAGQWIAWIVGQVGTNLVWKSEPFRLIVSDLPSIEDAIEQQYPTALEEMLAKTDEAIAAAEEIAEAEPVILAARDDAVEAKEGAEAAEHGAETAQGKAEDAQSAAEAARDVILGMTATAETLDPGSPATVEYDSGVMAFGIPRGADGQDGKDGKDGQDGAPGRDGTDGKDGTDGFSPTATVTKSGDTVTITITDKSGTTTAEVNSPDIDVATEAETREIIDEYGEDEDMLFETTWEYNSGSPYFVSVDDADDIADAFKSGKGVTFHMPTGTGEGSPSAFGIMDDIYVRMLVYEPGYTDGQGDDKPESFMFASSYIGASAGNIGLIDGIYVGQDGKLRFGVYVEPPTPKGGVNNEQR